MTKTKAKAKTKMKPALFKSRFALKLEPDPQHVMIENINLALLRLPLAGDVDPDHAPRYTVPLHTWEADVLKWLKRYAEIVSSANQRAASTAARCKEVEDELGDVRNGLHTIGRMMGLRR